METATNAQIERLRRPPHEITIDEMERIVRDAHIAHGFEATGRDTLRFLAPGAGYVTLGRPSRI